MLGDSLRLLRKMHSIPAKHLANKLGISATYLSEIENNKKKPTLDLLMKYAEYFKVKPSTILFFDESNSVNEPTVKTNLRNAFIRYAKALERCENRLLEEIDELDC